MFNRVTAVSPSRASPFHRAATPFDESDIFVDVLHETNKYVLISEPDRSSIRGFFEKNRHVAARRPQTNVALHLAHTDTTVGDSRESADPIFPVR